MTQYEPVISELLHDCEERLHFARQVICPDEALRKAFGDDVRKAFETLPRRYRLLRTDLNDCDGFPAMIRSFLRQIYDDPKFEAPDTLIAREEALAESDPAELLYLFTCIVKDDFEMENIFTLALLEHYERAAQIWTETDFGWIRSLCTDAQLFSILVVSDKSVEKVSHFPEGSSPFWNIFATAPVRLLP